MGESSKRSDVAAAAAVSQSVHSGEGNNKRVAEEEEIEQKLNLKKHKPDDQSTGNLDCSHSIDIGSAAAPDKKKAVKKSTGASKTLIANNLPFSIEKSHVIDFFKQVGDIVNVRLHYYYDDDDEDGQYRRVRSGHVVFATEEAANKAANLHDELLLGQRVKISPHLESTAAGASKTLVVEDLPFYTHKSDVIKFFKQVGEVVDVRFSKKLFSRSGHIEFATEEAAEKAQRLSGLKLSGSQVGLRRQARGTGASKTLCLKNLPFHFSKSDVINFFENVGDIADVRFSCDKDKDFRRVAHVEFATEEAALEAVKWNDRDLLGCPVRLGIVRETLCVKGLDTSLGIHEIRSFLEKHFQTCGGSITHVDVPEYRRTRDYYGVPLGSALVEFSSLEAFHRALDLDGQEVDGSSLTITDYVPEYLTVRGTGPREVTQEGFGKYCGTGYEKLIPSPRGYKGGGLGKNGSSLYPPAGNKIRFDCD
ncbi:hypothetical protein MKW94_007386 [Papaver nudicaule]|uniref:RRM domain-containing protein n=1 Tax=Papaver nudicaule TaxID=74823 RepID=A0AA41VEP9_PAPNU|nr:hypothetical protein [Papaver nudicaule]